MRVHERQLLLLDLSLANKFIFAVLRDLMEDYSAVFYTLPLLIVAHIEVLGLLTSLLSDE